MIFIAKLVWYVFLLIFAILLPFMYSAAVLSSDLSRQEEWEEAQRKFKDCNKQQVRPVDLLYY